MLRAGARATCGVLALAAGLFGCSSAPEPLAFQNKVFYEYDSYSRQSLRDIEVHYPPLDKRESPPLPEYVGISVFGGAVHLSRPRDWVVRAASAQPEHRYVEYVSPKEYVVGVYETLESPLDPWLDVMGRYEKQAADSGADMLGQRIPMATWNAQGRGYLVRRPVAAAKGPLVNYSNEYLLRGEHRIVLLQIVHPDEKLATAAELRRVVETIQLD